MRICLVSLTFPPVSTEGIPRQRHVLATELVRLGHEVHVITCHTHNRVRVDHGIIIHEVATTPTLLFPTVPVPIQSQLTQSLRLCACLMKLSSDYPVDIVDVPLWAAQGFVMLHRYPGKTVLWLQTTTSQLIEIEQRSPAPADHWQMSLERLCIEKADALLGDSHNCLNSILQDYGIHPTVPMEVVHLGLPRLPGATSFRPERDRVEAIVVGRLERRKGTPILFDILPDILRRHHNLQVYFAGRDNSLYDGWHQRYGMSYPEYFRRIAPDLADRVIFEGYVSEERLNFLYTHADFLIAPSVHESFGLVYLEAMRSGLPVVTFDNGGSREIFINGIQDGALIVKNRDSSELAQAIERLVEDSRLRIQIGQAGLSRFFESFESRLMAKKTSDFYNRVVSQSKEKNSKSCPLYHVLEFLEDGDAVSDIARKSAQILGDIGESSSIWARESSRSSKIDFFDLETIPKSPGGHLIFHYAGLNRASWVLNVTKYRKALYFHNITPPGFFHSNKDIRRHLIEGYRQLSRIVDDFDILIGDSRYNLKVLSKLIKSPKLSIHIYPVIEKDILERKYDQDIYRKLCHNTNFLFVGRFAPNKRQDQVIRAFDFYWREFDRRAMLWLVGNDTFDRFYRTELEKFRNSLSSRDNIVFTGKVSESALLAYFRAASIFLCASEHEGFCVPIAQAMAFSVPVIALAAAAVPETLLFSPGLMRSWDPIMVAETARKVLYDSEYREGLLKAQEQALARFTTNEARKRLSAVVRFLRSGEDSPLFDLLMPDNKH